MSALADIFAAVRLQLDGTGFEAQATALADKSGENVGTRLSQNLSASFKKAAGGAVGAGLGLAFASATNGALELNAALADFKAQTGAGDEEAQAFGKTLADLNKSNVQGIPEISNTLIALKQHFNLTGDAAKTAGAAFLDFARVAGTTGAAAAGNFDELIDAGVISVGEMAAMMDKLTWSHQKFGVPIQGTIDALVKFAPAMHAVGMTTDQALGLINLLTESGIDAAGATKAFNLALSKVKSPEELKVLMDDISTTENDFDRSQKAAALFGNRAGRQMANALKPGSDGIESFTPKLEDFTGATKDAGKALDESFGGRAALALKEVNGTLAEMGTGLGEILMVAALLGPVLGKAVFGIGGALAGVLAGSATVAAAAVPAAIIIAAIAGMPILMFQVIPRLAGSQPGDELAAGRALGLEDTATQTMVSVGLGNLLAQAVQDAGPALRDRGAEAGGAVADGVLTEMRNERAPVAAAARDLGDAIARPIATAATRSREEVIGSLRSMVDMFSTTWGELAAIASGTADAIYGPARRAGELAANAKEQHAQREILASHRSTKAQKDDARARLLALQEEGLGIRIEMAGRGELTKKAYDGLISELSNQAKSHNKEVAASAKLALAQLAKLKAEAGEPPKWRAGVWIGALGRAAGGPVSAGQPYVVGETQPEVFVPTSDGLILPSVPPGFGSGRSMPSLAAAGGGPFVYSPMFSSASPSEAQRFAREVGPWVTRWQQQRGL